VYGTVKLFEKETKTIEPIKYYQTNMNNSRKTLGKQKAISLKKILNAIKGFEITVQDLQGKVKISQNKSKDDLISVLKTLNNSSSDQEKAIAKLIKKYLESKE